MNKRATRKFMIRTGQVGGLAGLFGTRKMLIALWGRGSSTLSPVRPSDFGSTARIPACRSVPPGSVRAFDRLLGASEPGFAGIRRLAWDGVLAEGRSLRRPVPAGQNRLCRAT